MLSLLFKFFHEKNNVLRLQKNVNALKFFRAEIWIKQVKNTKRTRSQEK